MSLFVRQEPWPLGDGTDDGERYVEAGLEPAGTGLSDPRLCQFAYPAVIDEICMRAGESQAPVTIRAAGLMRPGRAPARLEEQSRSPRRDSNSHVHERTRASETRASASSTTRRRVNMQAPSMGFEPTTSTLTTWRALRAALRGH